MRRPWRVFPKQPPGAQTEVPVADDHSFTSFRSEPGLRDENKVQNWDAGTPALQTVTSFALSERVVQQAEREGRNPLRYLNNIFVQAIAVVCVVLLVLK